MNTDITGIGDFNKVKSAAQNYKNALLKAAQNVTTFNTRDKAFAGTVGKGSAKGSVWEYARSVESNMTNVLKLLDKLIASLNDVSSNYSKVENAAADKLSAASTKLRS